MTCPFMSSSVLEQYADNELPALEAERIRRHLDQCPICRGDYEESLQLKKLLRATPAVEPAGAYWEEVTPLILARTVESGAEENVSSQTGSPTKALVGSIVLLLAAITILVVAILLGSQHQERQRQEQSKPTGMLVSPLSDCRA